MSSSHNEDDFVAFEAAVQESFVGAAGGGSQEFSVPDNFWEILTSDPQLASNLESLIEERANRRFQELVLTQSESERARVFEEARKEGLQQGLKLGQKEIEAVRPQLNSISEGILAEKERILREHEESWIKALFHLLRRFMVPGGEEIGLSIKGWLMESLDNLADGAKVEVHLPEDDYERVAGALPTQAEDKWEWVRDSDLKAGELKCTSRLGGVFFSRSDEMKELEGIVHRYLQRVTKDA